MNARIPFPARFAALTIAIGSLIATGHGAEYFVGRLGSDTNSGASRQDAFRTIQRGVDALQAGDVLTIGPGEYFESVKRDGLGSADRETVIRAEIPGTAILRGDVALPAFHPAPGWEAVQVADFEGDVQTVNELDTFTIIEERPNVSELEFYPGSYHYDAKAKKLYLSTSDNADPSTHRYSASVVDAHGLLLKNATRVVIEGLAARGFNSRQPLPWKDEYKARRGIFFSESTRCVIRNCTAFLNGGGLLTATHSAGEANVIEQCEAYGNYHPFSLETANINSIHPNQSIIRDCLAYKGGGHGIKVYLGQTGPPRVERCISWGNRMSDIFVKGSGDLAVVTNSVAPKKCLVAKLHTSTYGGENIYQDEVPVPQENLFLGEDGLRPDREFADPGNQDYRLQSTSRFRGAAPDGKDQGAYPFQADVFFVKPDGNDAADGLSMDAAWRTFDHAVSVLKPGDTLYLATGTYSAGKPVTLGKPGPKRIRVLGRGDGTVVLSGRTQFSDCTGLDVERLNFADEASVSGGDGVVLRNCRFLAPSTGLEAKSTENLRVEHCQFSGFRDAAIRIAAGHSAKTGAFLSSNLYDNTAGPALVLAGGIPGEILYSDYNAYRNGEAIWMIADTRQPLAAIQSRNHEIHAKIQTPKFAAEEGMPALQNAIAFAGAGRNGKSIGLHRLKATPELQVNGPKVHSVTDTTANIEWKVSGWATCKIAWGKTPECENQETVEVNAFGTFSLTGLEPATAYFFRLESVRLVDERGAVVQSVEPAAVPAQPLRLTTLAGAATPRTFYVSPAGNDARDGLSLDAAWQTIAHAASQANKGDTVLIAPGTYEETVRVRNTGDTGSPITFRSAGGGKTILAGNGSTVNKGVIVSAKAHIIVDGLYLERLVRGTESSAVWPVGTGAGFLVYQSRDVAITRCFYDGRQTGYTPRFLMAVQSADILVRNCVLTNAFHAVQIDRCSDVRIENNVFLRNMITNVSVSPDSRKVLIRRNIITDNLLSKRRITMVPVPSANAWGETTDNCYFLRVPFLERENLFGENLDSQEWAGKTRTLFADPEFPISASVRKFLKPGGWIIDEVRSSAGELDFPDVFATNPEVTARGMGLVPADFPPSAGKAFSKEDAKANP